MSETLEVKAAIEVTDAGEITGQAWPFGSPDRVGDLIQKGAINTPDRLPMLWSHDQAEVIGVWDQITETAEGLTVKGRLLVDTVARAREVHAMVKAGAVSGLSIGFVTKQAQRHAKGRTIKALDLREISIVAIPAHPGAQITSVKSQSTSKEFSPVENEELAQAAEIETKQAPANDAPQIDQKAFDILKDRLEKLEAKSALKAPAIIQGNNIETKAFVDFVRSGDALELKALAVSAPSTGGILAPDTTSAKILEKVVELSPVRQLSSVIQMNSSLLKLPRLVEGVEPAITTEQGPKPDDEPVFEEITLEPYLAGVSVPVTHSMLEDSHVDLEQYIVRKIAMGFAQKESAWFVNGDGTTAPEGVMAASAGIPEFDAAGVTVTADDLIDVFYSLPQAHSDNGAWLMNRHTAGAIRKLSNANGDYLWQAGIAAGQPATLLGRPVYLAPDMPNVTADAAPILFGDFAFGYTVADRVGVQIIRDEITGVKNDLIRLTARRRVGARVTMPSAFTKLVMAAA